jgi:TP901 family phage tail tape measure protein
MAAKYSLEAVFRLIDRVTAPTSKIDKALSKLGIKSKAVNRMLKNDFNKAAERVDKLGKSIGQFTKGVALAGVAAVGAGLAVATKQFIDYDSAVTAATAKFKDVDVTSDAFGKTLKEVGKVAREVAAATEYNAVDTAGALDKMAMAGLTSAQSMRLLMGTTNLATAAGTDLTTAVDIATDALGAFQMMSLNEDVLAGNLDRLSDVMAKTTIMFNTDMAGMYEAIKKGGPTFASAGQQVEDFSALIGVLASSGIKGSEAGTQLRNIMLALANPTGEAGRILSQLGIVTKDANGNFLNVIDVVGQFERRMQGMGSAQKAAYLSTLFGTRAVTGMNILLAEGVDKLRGYRAELVKADELDATKGVAEAMRGSIKNKIEVMKSALTELGFKFVEAFQTKGVALIERITDAIGKFDPQSIINFAVGSANAVGTFITFVAGAIKMAWRFRYVLIALVAPLMLYHGLLTALAVASKFFTVWEGIKKAAVFAFTLVNKGQTAALATLKAGTTAYIVVSKIFSLATAAQTAATGAATGAQWLLNAAMLANPIGLVVIIIIALIAAIIGMVKWWKAATTGVEGFGAKLYAFVLLPVKKLMELLSKLPGKAGEYFKGISEKVNGIYDDLHTQKSVEVEVNAVSGVDALDSLMPEIPGFEIPVGLKTPEGLDTPASFEMYTTGTTGSGKNPLHGVYDISGALPFTSPVAQSAVPGISTQAASTVTLPAGLLTGVSDIAVSVKHIDTVVARLVETRTASTLPSLSFERGESESNPSVIAPITQAERMAYSLQEYRETVVIEVSTSKETSARVVSAPRDVDVRLIKSGGVG